MSSCSTGASPYKCEVEGEVMGSKAIMYVSILQQ